MLTHRSIGANNAQAKAWVPALHEGAEVFYAVLPLFHAFGLCVSLFAGIHLGATIALLPKFDVPMLLEAQRRLPCTFFIGVAPMFDRILTGVRDTPTDLSSIAYALSGAMILDPDLARRWEEATGGLLVEGYGMTEASPVILGSPLSSGRRASTLGIPFPSTEIRIVNPDDPDTDVADGEVGELLVRGPQVFAGYWDNEQETKAAFHNGWLRTGDLVRVDDGFVVMADRRKELIISGGFNIYPSQVEDAVRSMPGVEDVAVVGLPRGVNGEAVVAALILEAGATVTLEDVRRWAEQSISHYALPRQIVILTELPRSQIGKVMRRKVRDYLVDAGERLSESTVDLREKLRAGTEAARQQLSDLSEQVEATTHAASDRIRDLRSTWMNAATSTPDERGSTEPESAEPAPTVTVSNADASEADVSGTTSTASAGTLREID